MLLFLVPPVNEVWGKVICLQVCVCPQGGAWSQGVPGPGGGAWSRGEPAPRGVSAPRGSGPGWGCLVEAPRTATAAGGTHPTGMHSCFCEKLHVPDPKTGELAALPEPAKVKCKFRRADGFHFRYV